MTHGTRVGFAALALLMALPLLAACHTVEGAGQDVSATGHAVTDTARKVVQ